MVSELIINFTMTFAFIFLYYYSFQLTTDYIPDGFLQDYIRVDEARHLIFASPDQLKVLSRTKTWYLYRLHINSRTRSTSS